MSLEISEQTHERQDLVVVGTAIIRSEGLPQIGRVYIFAIIDVVPEPGIPQTGRKFKLIIKEELKGAVTAVSPIGSQGFLMVAQGQKCLVRGLKEDGTLLPVAFIDMQCYVTVVKELKGTGMCLMADAIKGVWLTGYYVRPSQPSPSLPACWGVISRYPPQILLTERTKNNRRNLTKSVSLANPHTTSKQSRQTFLQMENSYTSLSQTQTATSTSSNSTPTVRLLSLPPAYFPPSPFTNNIPRRPQIPLRHSPPPPHNLPHRPLPFNTHPPPFLLPQLSTPTNIDNRLPRTDKSIININVQNAGGAAVAFAKYPAAAAWV